MKDIQGHKLRIGDLVLTYAPRYKHLIRAEVIKFTPKMIKIKYNTDETYRSTNGVVRISKENTNVT